MSDRHHDPNRVLASLAQRGLALELNTVDLCFVAALYVRAERSKLASFEEDQLTDIFQQVCNAIDPGADSPQKRATHAIRRLRDQRMLARIDGAGVVRAGEYALTRLATGIVEFYLEEEALTRESLTLLTRTLLGSLAEVLSAARKAQTDEAWRADVVGPLRVTVADLVGGIERRQRGFDVQQEDFQRELAKLLQGDWFGAIDRCQTLLESTSATLRELNQVLLRDTHQIQALLQDIQELAVASENVLAEEATRGVVDQIDRIAAWGSARQRAWSEYYQYVHRYLRDVVRLDPARTLTQRLREQLAGKTGKRFSLTVAMAPSMRLLRAVDPPKGRPPVRNRRKEPKPAIAEEPTRNPEEDLAKRVRAAIAGGASGLAEVATEVTAECAPEARFVAIGRIAQLVATFGSPRATPPRPWVPVGDGVVIEEWKMINAGVKAGVGR